MDFSSRLFKYNFFFFFLTMKSIVYNSILIIFWYFDWIFIFFLFNSSHIVMCVYRKAYAQYQLDNTWAHIMPCSFFSIFFFDYKKLPIYYTFLYTIVSTQRCEMNVNFSTFNFSFLWRLQQKMLRSFVASKYFFFKIFAQYRRYYGVYDLWKQ